MLACELFNPKLPDVLSCKLEVDELLPFFNNQSQNIDNLTIVFPASSLQENIQVDFEPSITLINNPVILKTVFLCGLNLTWSGLLVFMQHFNIVQTYYPVIFPQIPHPLVEDDLQGLKLEGCKLVDDIIVSDDGGNLILKSKAQNKQRKKTTDGVDENAKDVQQIASMKVKNSYDLESQYSVSAKDNITSLVLNDGYISKNDENDVWQFHNMFVSNKTIPDILLIDTWPVLRYLELDLTYLDSTQILTLNKTAPKLDYLKLYLPMNLFPDFVWNFDWISLSYQLVVVVVSTNQNGPSSWNDIDISFKQKIDPSKEHRFQFNFPIITFYDFRPRDVLRKDRDYFVDVDLSYLDLWYTSLNLKILIQPGFILRFNMSHNDFDHSSFLGLTISPFIVVSNYKLCFWTRCPSPELSDVRVLDLSYNNLQNFSYINWACESSKYCGLHELYIHHNALEGQMNLAFIYFWKLNILDASYNQYTHTPKHLLSISKLYFTNNNLTQVGDGIFNAGMLKLADLSFNKIIFEGIFPEEVITRETIIHTSIHLENNNVGELDLSLLNEAVVSELHHVFEKFDIYLDGNPINCSCKTHSTYKYLVSSSKSERTHETVEILPDFSFYKNQWKCVYPSHWAGMPLVKIPEYTFDKYCVESLEECSVGCYCYHSWTLNDIIVANCSQANEHEHSTLPATVPDKTSRLILSHNRIKSFCGVKPYLKHLQVLDLSYNSLRKICSGVFKHLGGLTELNLATNNLKHIASELFQLTSLMKLYMNNNYLQDIPVSVKNWNHSAEIDISGNTFRCDCDTFWMTGWLLNNSGVRHPKSILCYSGKGQGKRITDLHQDDVGCNDQLIHALIGLAVTVILVVILLTVTYRYRGYIKVWLYARFGFHPWDKVQENPQEMDYDAFVSFSRKDANWVFDTLMPHLEAPQCGFHLCVHDRDFVPGATINKNITTAIKYSRRTILILTPDFIKSEWCEFELQAAHQRVLEDRSNFLIVVVLKEVDDKDLDEVLKLYMKTNTYVKVSDKWFWQKLLYAMPKIPIDELKAPQKNVKNRNVENRNDQNSKKGGNNRNDGNNRNLGNKRNDVNNRNLGNNRNDVNKWNKRNKKNDRIEIELGAAGGFDTEGAEGDDVPLLHLEVGNDVMDKNHYDDDDVALLIDVDNTDEEKHDPGKSGQENMEGDGAAVHCHDHITDISGSDGDVTTDSNDEKFDADQVYKHPVNRNRDAVARLPPLFKRMNTYNDIMN